MYLFTLYRNKYTYGKNRKPESKFPSPDPSRKLKIKNPNLVYLKISYQVVVVDMCNEKEMIDNI